MKAKTQKPKTTYDVECLRGRWFFGECFDTLAEARRYVSRMSGLIELRIVKRVGKVVR